MEDLTLYSLADPLYFESLERFQGSPDFREGLHQHVPDDWHTQIEGVWLMAVCPSAAMPRQGFKIHVSATPVNALQVLDRVAPICVAQRANFKIARAPELVTFMGIKNYGRGGSGKFITIYPNDDAHFVTLCEALHQATRDLEGPYILSDQRYKESRVIYYRYGGFVKLGIPNVAGSTVHAIVDPQGRMIPDERLPYFKLPEWIDDPFGNPRTIEGNGKIVLNNRYRVESAYTFSNAGGVYSARDQQTGEIVVIKEARPHTNMVGNGGDALDAAEVLRREYAALERISDLDIAPRPIDFFSQWEHSYLVESFIPGSKLTSFRSRLDITLLPFTGDPERTMRFCRAFHTIGMQVIDLVEALHARDLLLPDLAPQNIFVTADDMTVRLIDLEGVVDRQRYDHIPPGSAALGTPGFFDPQRATRGLDERDGHYAAGMVLFSLVLPVASLFQLEPNARHRFMALARKLTALPDSVPEAIDSLLEGDPARARVALVRLGESMNTAGTLETHPRSGVQHPLHKHELAQAIEHMVGWLGRTHDPQRTDRLWPPDPQVFKTNPLSLAYGACGTALTMRAVNATLPEGAERWLLHHCHNTTDLPPGLHVGAAGVAYALAELGHMDAAETCMASVYRSPFLYQDATVYQGMAGWGWTSLYLHLKTGKQVYYDHARRAGERIIDTAEVSADGWCWRPQDSDTIYHGFALGASGIACYLIELHRASNDARFIDAARRALDFEVAHAVESNGRRSWPSTTEGGPFMPYWLHGSCGVGMAAVRLWAETRAQWALDLARDVAVDAYTLFSALPGQHLGLAGIGEFLLDMYHFTGEAEYLDRARIIARSILCYRVECPEGWAFPGRQLTRLSADFAFGTAGIAAFFERALRPGPRLAHDLPPAMTKPSPRDKSSERNVCATEETL